MKNKTLVGINKRLSDFYVKVYNIAVPWAEGWSIDNPGTEDKREEVLHRFQTNICMILWDNGTNEYIDKVIQAATDCGFEFLGAGMSRIALGTTFHSNDIVIKVEMRKHSNMKEFNCAEKAVNNNHAVFLQVALIPTFYWDNDDWGPVLAYPKAPIINKGKWSPAYVSDTFTAESDWEDTGLPEEFQTSEFAKQLGTIKSISGDAHERNIGVMNGKPYLIDYDLI